MRPSRRPISWVCPWFAHCRSIAAGNRLSCSASMTALVDPSTAAFAHRLADVAGEVIRPFFRKRIEVTNKAKRGGIKPLFDPVTEADRNAEAPIRALIPA